MKLSKGVLSLLTVAMIFAVVGGGVAWKMFSESDSNGETERAELPDTEGVEVASAAGFAGAQPVAGTEVVRDTLWINVTANGEADANRRSLVAARASGVVEEVFVGENQLVQAGEILVQLDTVEAAIQLAQARAQLAAREADFQERQLYSGDVGSLRSPLTPEERAERERLIRIESGLQAAEFEVEQAELNMDLTRVRAPFSGRVADLEAVEGAYLSAGSEVLTLVQIDPIRVQVNVLESDILYLNTGRRATVRFTAIPGETFEARVESVNPLVDPENRTGRVTLTLPNPGGMIRPGMYAAVSVEGQAYPDRILVPREAIVERGDDRRKVVFVATQLNENGEGVTDWRYVTTGYSNETHIEIVPAEDTYMVEPGEIVLTTAHHYIGHDVRIRLVDADQVVAEGGIPGR